MDSQNRQTVPLRQARSRLRRAMRWLGSSAVAACAGALVAGLIEAREAPGAVGALAAMGFVAVIALPALMSGSVIVRALVRAWQPAGLAADLVDADGAAPRLAGWVAVIWLGAVGLAAAIHQSVWTLFAHTAFKPLTLSFVEPAVAVAVALALVAVSRPSARLLAWLARRIDARWRRGGRGTLLRPRIILGAACVAGLAALYALWRLVIRPQLGPIDTSLVHAPAAGLAAAGAMHAVWPRLPSRALVGLGCAAAIAVVLATAAFTAWARPSLTLELWGDRPHAGVAIDALFDLEAVRARIPSAELRPAARAGAAHPDILLITIDTVRADHTPPYGGRADMPALRDLAARGVVFDWAFSPSNVTRRSIPSIVTGVAPHRVRGRVVGWALRLDPRHVVLAERLRAAGYDTAGFMCCEGFWGKEFRTGLERGLAHLVIDEQGARLAAGARRWLDERARRPARAPLFLWMHILEPHNWTHGTGDPRAEPQRSLAYDRSLTAADRMLADVLAPFHGRTAAASPIVIVTADHGEGLGEHGQPFHSTDLYNSQIRVPLVIAGPGIQPGHVPETVSLTDVTPTLLDLAGFVPPPGATVDGRSLADLATGARAGDPDGGTAFAAMIKDRSNPGGVTAIVHGRWKLIDEAGTVELYDTRGDPGERDDIAGKHPAEVVRLRKLLDARLAQATASPFR